MIVRVCSLDDSCDSADLTVRVCDFVSITLSCVCVILSPLLSRLLNRSAGWLLGLFAATNLLQISACESDVDEGGIELKRTRQSNAVSHSPDSSGNSGASKATRSKSSKTKQS